MKDIVEKYLEHLDKIFEVDPEFLKYSDDEDYPPFHTLTYHDIPEFGLITGITSGISFVPSPNKKVRKELLICVESNDPSWVLAMADIGYQHRRTWKFDAGDTVKFHGKISEESDMTSFLIWHQSTINEDYELICLPEWHVLMMGLFPIHDDERELIVKHGTDWFFELIEDPCDVTRASVANEFKIIH